MPLERASALFPNMTISLHPDFVTAQVRLHCFRETTVQNFLDSGI